MKKSPKFSRRTVIAATAGATLIPLASIAPAQSTNKALSAGQRRTLEAIVDRLIPKDENGPGAVEAGAAEYIDRCLADYLANEKAAFLNGLTAADALAQRTQGSALADLSSDKRDAVLMAMESSTDANLRGFFNRTRRLTLEGMFGDPAYGGNQNFAGWDLINYPGAKMATTPADQSMKTPPQKTRKALYKDAASHAH